jgi:hypothetical protein
MAHKREEKHKRTARHSDGHRTSNSRDHGDVGFNGERERAVESYGHNAVGGCVDAYLTSDALASFTECVKYATGSHGGGMGEPKGDRPRGVEPMQSGPMFGDRHGMDSSGRRPGKAKKGQY